MGFSKKRVKTQKTEQEKWRKKLDLLATKIEKPRREKVRSLMGFNSEQKKVGSMMGFSKNPEIRG